MGQRLELCYRDFEARTQGGGTAALWLWRILGYQSVEAATPGSDSRKLPSTARQGLAGEDVTVEGEADTLGVLQAEPNALVVGISGCWGWKPEKECVDRLPPRRRMASCRGCRRIMLFHYYFCPPCGKLILA